MSPRLQPPKMLRRLMASLTVAFHRGPTGSSRSLPQKSSGPGPSREKWHVKAVSQRQHDATWYMVMSNASFTISRFTIGSMIICSERLIWWHGYDLWHGYDMMIFRKTSLSITRSPHAIPPMASGVMAPVATPCRSHPRQDLGHWPMNCVQTSSLFLTFRISLYCINSHNSPCVSNPISYLV